MLRILPILALALAAARPASAQDITAPQPTDGSTKIRIEVSFLLVDVVRILDDEQSIELDLMYRLKWRDPALAEPGAAPRIVDASSIWVPRLQAISPRGINALLPESVIVEEDGTLTYTQRLNGSLGAPTYLADFPFDSHTIDLTFFFTGGAHVGVEPVEGEIVEMSPTLTIPDWRISGERLSLEPIVISQELPAVPAVTFHVEAERISSHYVVSVLFPLIVIVMMSWTVFWAPPTNIAVQFGFAATSILTVIAYRFALANQIPPLPYSTRLDTFLTGAFVLAFLALVEVIVTARLIYRDRTEAAERVDRTCRWSFPAALALLGGYAFGL